MKNSLLKSLFFACSVGLTSLSGSLFGVEYLSDPELSPQEYWQKYEDTVADYYHAFPAGQSSEIEMQKHIDLNLIWLSKSIVGKNKYVFPEVREKLEVAPYIKDWVAKGYKVKFWFDSLASTESQVIETQKLFQSIEKSLKLEESRLELVDIWTVRSVQDKRDFFTNISGLVPIYLRADLIRLMISLDQIQNGTQYSVDTDLDVKAVPLCELMDKDQQELLKAIGMVVARGGVSLGMENAFHVVSRQENVVKALDLTLEANFKRFDVKTDKMKKDAGQQVYDAYPPMFRLLYHLQGLGTLKFSNGNIFDLETDRQAAIESFCELAGYGYYNNYFTGFRGSFTWNDEKAAVLKELVRKDTLKDEIRYLERARNRFRNNYLPTLDQLQVIDAECKIIEDKIQVLEKDEKELERKWELLLPENKNDLDEEFNLVEGNIRNLNRELSKLKRKNKQYNSYRRDLISLPKQYHLVSSLRSSENPFELENMWIPKVTVDRPASKGSGYN